MPTGAIAILAAVISISYIVDANAEACPVKSSGCGYTFKEYNDLPVFSDKWRSCLCRTTYNLDCKSLSRELGALTAQGVVLQNTANGCRDASCRNQVADELHALRLKLSKAQSDFDGLSNRYTKDKTDEQCENR